jgi:hypothetical protein
VADPDPDHCCYRKQPEAVYNYTLASLYYQIAAPAIQQQQQQLEWLNDDENDDEATNTPPETASILLPTLPPQRKRIRVAFLSSFFFRHSVGRLLGGVVLELSSRSELFEVFVVNPVTQVSADITAVYCCSLCVLLFIVLLDACRRGLSLGRLDGTDQACDPLGNQYVETKMCTWCFP